MTGNRAAIRYAKAALSLAVEQNNVEQVNADMQLITTAFKESKDLKLVLESEVIKAAKKKEILLNVFSNTHELTKKLFNLLIENKRINILDYVALEYTALYNKLTNKQEATVITATPLTAALKEKVLKKITELTPNTVTLKNIIDETILGGFILRLGDQQYNASVANNLNKLKRQFKIN